MNAQTQLFLKLFVLYLVLFGSMTLLFDYMMGNELNFKSAPLFILVAAFLSWRRSRKMTTDE